MHALTVISQLKMFSTQNFLARVRSCVRTLTIISFRIKLLLKHFTIHIVETLLYSTRKPFQLVSLYDIICMWEDGWGDVSHHHHATPGGYHHDCHETDNHQ
jgi:hypothetical protein